MKQFFTMKNAVIGIILFVLVIIVIVAYRMFFQFNSKDISTYINEEANKYPANNNDVYKLIQDGVEYILSSHNLTQQVIRSASVSNIPKEMELVHVAVLMAQNNGYLEKPTV